MLRSKGAPEIEDDLNGNMRFRTTDLANHKIERDHRTIYGEHRTSSRTSDREERTSSRTSDRGNEHRIPNNEIRITNREQRRTERWCRRRKVGYRKDERETRSMDREAKHDYDSNRISRSMEFECEEELRPSIQVLNMILRLYSFHFFKHNFDWFINVKKHSFQMIVYRFRKNSNVFIILDDWFVKRVSIRVWKIF